MTLEIKIRENNQVHTNYFINCTSEIVPPSIACITSTAWIGWDWSHESKNQIKSVLTFAVPWLNIYNYTYQW